MKFCGLVGLAWIVWVGVALFLGGCVIVADKPRFANPCDTIDCNKIDTRRWA